MRTQVTKMMVACFLIAGLMDITHAQSFTDPVFTSKTTVVDFGEVDSKTDPGFRTLTFTNNGSSPLIITHIQPSCGCTIPEWPKDAIQPGKSNEIKVKYDITRIGAISKTITITTNEPDGKDADGNTLYKQHVIQVKGSVR